MKKYLLPSDLAKMAGCSEKTIREYCRRDRIPGATPTPGGHWRIRRPLSEKTKLFLRKLKGEWPHDGSKDFEGEFESDTAGWLMEAKLYEKDWQECFPAPELADLEPSKREAAAQIQALIWDKLKSGTGFSHLHLLGWVYQFWLKNEDYPSVAKIAGLMGISRSEFYRQGRNAKEIREAYHALCERIRIAPDQVPEHDPDAAAEPAEE